MFSSEMAPFDSVFTGSKRCRGTVSSPRAESSLLALPSLSCAPTGIAPPFPPQRLKAKVPTLLDVLVKALPVRPGTTEISKLLSMQTKAPYLPKSGAIKRIVGLLWGPFLCSCGSFALIERPRLHLYARFVKSVVFEILKSCLGLCQAMRKLQDLSLVLLFGLPHTVRSRDTSYSTMVTSELQPQTTSFSTMRAWELHFKQPAFVADE